jgi:hypothetical protein
MNNDRIIYKLSVKDLQTVAEDKLDRPLSENEIVLLEDKIGNYIDWYGAIENALDDLT